MNLQLRDLKYFETIAANCHLGLASEKLGRTQPALTKAVQRLEESFGCELFLREGRGLTLTPAGHLLLSRARQVRGVAEEAMRAVQDYASGSAGHLRIGSGPIAADHVLPEICNLLLAQTPGITIEITLGPSVMLREQLRDGALDLLIGLMPEADDSFMTHAIVDDVVVVVAGKNHPVFKRRRITMKSLLDWRWVLPEQTIPSRQWLDATFRSRGLPAPTAQISANSIPLLPQLIAHSGLLGFLSRHNLQAQGRRGALREVPLEELTLRRRLGVSYRRDGYLSPAALRLLTLLRTRGQAMFHTP